MERASTWLIAAVPCLIILRGSCCRVDTYRAFVSGAKDGFHTALELIPALAAMMLMLEMTARSGLEAILTNALAPLTDLLRLPKEAAPLLILRPLTGSGSLSALEGIFAAHGPDSRVGMAASVLAASTETVFYTLTVYLSAAGVKHLPWVVPVSLVSGLVGALVCGLII